MSYYPWDLTQLERMNVACDLEAKNFRTDPRCLNHLYLMIPHESWTVWVGNQKIVKDMETQIREFLTAPSILEYWASKGLAVPGAIDWDGMNDAMRAERQSRRTWITKHVTGICGVGTVMVRWKERDTPECVLCGEVEDAKHVWECRSPRSLERWDQSLAILDKDLEALKTAPDIRTAIISSLWRWKHNKPQEMGAWSPDVRDLVQEQEQFGWDNFIEGRILTGWRQAQHNYWQFIRTRRSSRRWTEQLIRKLWQVAWDQWELRNEITHGSEDGTHDGEANALRERIRQELATERQYWQLTERHLLQAPEGELTAMSRDHQRHWLSVIQTIQERTERRLIEHHHDT